MAERKNTGIAVPDAKRLNDCYHELSQAIAARPAMKGDRDLWKYDYASLPGGPEGAERERWSHRCGSDDVALVALRGAVTNGNLQLWTYGPQGEAKVDRYELKEPTFRTFKSGTYQPDNRRLDVAGCDSYDDGAARLAGQVAGPGIAAAPCRWRRVMTGYPDAPGHRGVDTSIAAADALAPKLGRLQRLAETTIRAAGPDGLTADELAARLDMERWSIQPRTTELSRKGMIRDSGRRRRNETGKAAIVWVAPAFAPCTEAQPG